jgi:hypothetical protein
MRLSAFTTEGYSFAICALISASPYFGPFFTVSTVSARFMPAPILPVRGSAVAGFPVQNSAARFLNTYTEAALTVPVFLP